MFILDIHEWLKVRVNNMSFHISRLNFSARSSLQKRFIEELEKLSDKTLNLSLIKNYV